MPRPLHRALLSLALFAACTTSAQAVVSIEAKITGLTLTATNLNLADGQAAGFEWSSQPKNFVSAQTAILKNGWENIAIDTRFIRNSLPILSSQIAQGSVQGASSINMNGAYLFVKSAEPLGAYANAWSRETEGPSALVVSPFTRITLTAQASIAFTSDPLCQTVFVDGFERSCNGGHAALTVELNSAFPLPGARNEFQVTLDFDSRTGSDRLNTPVLLTLDNNTDQEAYFGLDFGGATWISNNMPGATTVPEPGELGLLMAGLVTLLLVHRRRQAGLLKKGLAVAAVASLSAPAWSAMTMETQIAQLQFTATDLDPADGQAARFEWLTTGSGNQNKVDAQVYQASMWSPVARDTHIGDALFAPVSALAQKGDVLSTASITANGLHLWSEARDKLSARADAYLGPNSGLSGNLWLAPHTRITLTGQATFKFTNNQLCGDVSHAVTACGYAFGEYHLGFRKSAGLDLKSNYFFSGSSGTTGIQETTVPILLTFENNRSEGTTLEFYGYARNQATVPEPETLALMLAGMMVACSIGVRRRA
ncbi:PEP-CTERM sorting domain-containing protein [Aquabacterium sp.]|uniref:PEP-CTERM sorting domain-containing protein n=1 Tax=Aquabacterium sp. TaxID=1872578 RepID=UPI0024887F5D|nr:PEP-CTERM sorting domain-containing protein [Aquabacterium sp.]MDI1260027.1 PEP-CTERM sorting domain-containing protein [Aquabacterium sp.]